MHILNRVHFVDMVVILHNRLIILHNHLVTLKAVAGSIETACRHDISHIQTVCIR